MSPPKPRPKPAKSDQTTVLVCCKNQLSFDTFMALGEKEKGYHYIFMNTPEQIGICNIWGTRIMMLSDFHEHPDYNEILTILNKGIKYFPPSQAYMISG